MPAIGHIVVGLDESRLADAAVVSAVHLSRLFRVPLHAVHAVRFPAERPWLTDSETVAWLRDQAMNDARRDRAAHLLAILKPMATTRAEVDRMLHVEIGRPAATLSRHAGGREGSILVLGGHRHRGLLDFGGTTRDMIGHLPCPLWVQEQHAWREIRRILVPIDLHPGSEAVLSLAAELAAAAGAAITALHAFETPDYRGEADARLTDYIAGLRRRQREELDAFLARRDAGGPPVEARFEEGPAAAAVLALEGEHDVIVMGTHGHSALGRALVGSQAYSVLRHASRPVVVVPQRG